MMLVRFLQYHQKTDDDVIALLDNWRHRGAIAFDLPLQHPHILCKWQQAKLSSYF